MKNDALKVEIERLRHGSIETDFEVSPEAMDLHEDPEFTFALPVRGHLKASLAGTGNILIRGHMETTARADCVRCLEPLDFPLRTEYSIMFLARPEPEEAERFQEIADDEKFYHDGDFVYPLEAMREELMISLPQLPSCSYESTEDCPTGREILKAAQQAAAPPEEPAAAPEQEAETGAANWQAQIEKVRRQMEEGTG